MPFKFDYYKPTVTPVLLKPLCSHGALNEKDVKELWRISSFCMAMLP